MAGSAAVDVLRHGWQDAASTFAPDVPQVAELLQARLEVAVANGGLDERHLLEAIGEVEAAASRAGSPAGDLLVRRLRRTVYEYLLALDAAPASGHRPEGVAVPVPTGPMVGAEEIAELKRHSAAAAAAAPHLHIATSGDTAADEPAAVPAADAAPSPGWQPRVSGSTPAERVDPGPANPSQPHPSVDMVVAPRSGFHIVEDTHPTTVPTGRNGSPLTMPAFAGEEPELAVEPLEREDAMTVFLPQSTAGEQLLDQTPRPLVIDQAAVPTSAPASGPPPTEAFPPEFQAWRAAISDAALAREELALAERNAAPGPWAPPAAAAPATPDAVAEVSAVPPPPPPLPPSAPLPATAERSAAAAAPETVWRVREQGVSATGGARDAAGRPASAPPPPDDDPFETSPRLEDIRQRIEERLRRKRCDDAAALLQELAQEAGGRVVAELAMNAGDRCRMLGKSNAALSCYLAASRADPLLETPLVRLADICIDDQDTDLAVTYLERVAQLHRLRGDDKSALRVYRRIVTIAPYREDMLATLMTAQSTGRFDG